MGISSRLKSYLKTEVLGDLLSRLDKIDVPVSHKDGKFLEWLNSDLVELAEEFVIKHNLSNATFILRMNSTFGTERFNILLKRWIIEYMLKLFMILDNFIAVDNDVNTAILLLEDVPVNRFAIFKYSQQFNVKLNIKWQSKAGFLKRSSTILVQSCFTLYLGLKKGIRFSKKRKKFKVMREAIWGLYGIGGYFFHDDFLVDGKKIKNQDLLLFSRPSLNEAGRIKAAMDAKKSPYAHCNLASLPVGFNDFTRRIIFKYICCGNSYLASHIKDSNYSLFFSIYRYFVANAVPYEKLFSNYEIISELGHSYFSAAHVVDSIVCQDRGVRYYLMHWSDISTKGFRRMFSFLSCDKYLLWGVAHIKGKEGDPSALLPIGYVFKKFIHRARELKEKILHEMKVEKKGRVISFFDEPFGGEVRMTQQHFIAFWDMILKIADSEKENTLIIKPKGEYVWANLTGGYKRSFDKIRAELSTKSNVYFIDANKWSFIEAIGVSDIVVTQGMTSSATIAIISGIEGLYFDQVNYEHPFSTAFKDIFVFNEPEKLIEKIHRLLYCSESVFQAIPEDLMRKYDAYSDDNGIERLRNILLGETVCA